MEQTRFAATCLRAAMIRAAARAQNSDLQEDAEKPLSEVPEEAWIDMRRRLLDVAVDGTFDRAEFENLFDGAIERAVGDPQAAGLIADLSHHFFDAVLPDESPDTSAPDDDA